jgi:hypothetical protein
MKKAAALIIFILFIMPFGFRAQWARSIGPGNRNCIVNGIQIDNHVCAMIAYDESGTGIMNIGSVKIIEFSDISEEIVSWSFDFEIEVNPIEYKIEYRWQDEGHAIAQTNEGGFIIGGSAARIFFEDEHANERTKETDLFLAKLDMNKEIEWHGVYGTYGEKNIEAILSVTPTHDGGYVACGMTSSFGEGSFDVLVMRLDSGGNVLWQNSYGGGQRDEGYFISEMTDGGLLIVGNTESFGAANKDIWIIKLYPDGKVAWQKMIGSAGIELIHSVIELDDGCILIAGEVRSTATEDCDAMLFKLNPIGTIEWQWAYGTDFDEWIEDVRATQDGGYIVTGTIAAESNKNILILKLTSWGSIEWARVFGNPESFQFMSDEVGFLAFQSKEDGYLVFGGTDSLGPSGLGILLLKLSSLGSMHYCKLLQEKALIMYPTSLSSVDTYSESNYIYLPKINTSMRVGSPSSPEFRRLCPEKNYSFRR